MAQSVIKLFHLPISVIEILLFLLPQLPFSIIALFKEILMRQFPASLHHHRMDDAFPVIKSWGNIDRFIYFIRADETPLLQQRSLSLEFNLWWHPLLSITLPIGKISILQSKFHCGMERWRSLEHVSSKQSCLLFITTDWWPLGLWKVLGAN